MISRLITPETTPPSIPTNPATGPLADGLETLSKSSAVKDISYPRLLALMLLGDWVFAQQSLIVTRVAQLVTSKPGFRNVLAAMLRDRGGVSLVMPERCGMTEIVAAAKSVFVEGGHRDEETAVARVIKKSLSAADVVSYWRGLKTPNAPDDQWISRGAQLGVFRFLPKDELVALCGEISARMVSYLAAEDRFDVLKSDGGLFAEQFVLLSIAAGDFFFQGKQGGDGSFHIQLWAGAGSPNIYARASQFAAEAYAALVRRNASTVLRTSEVCGSAIRRKRCRSAPDRRLIDKFLGLFREAFGTGLIAVWSTTLAPWSKLIGEGVSRVWKFACI